MSEKCQTYGEQFESALRCETPAEAELWMEQEVRHYVEHHNTSPLQAIDIIKYNLGYMAGYYSNETAEKIKRLFSAPHPGYSAFDETLKGK